MVYYTETTDSEIQTAKLDGDVACFPRFIRSDSKTTTCLV